MKVYRIVTLEGLVITLEAESLHKAMVELKEAGYAPLRVTQVA